MKKCPFKKIYVAFDYKLCGKGFPIIDYQEKFNNCIGEECMAYSEEYQHCELIKKIPQIN